MGTKHDVLTEAEMASFELNPRVVEHVNALCACFPGRKPSEMNILDWGCGRGRSVARLREKGFNAFGVDIDRKTLANGSSLFEQRGLSPDELLRCVDDVKTFDDRFFHCIFSEQVLEHVEDLPGTLKEIGRLTVPGGTGIHFFPGAKNVWEGHVHMPLVHWLPKTVMRRYWISAMLLFGYGPREPWAEAKGTSAAAHADLYCRYMNNKTFYRDTREINEEFEKNGFISRYEVNASRLMRLLPKRLLRNGFPRGGVVFSVKRRA